METVVIGVVSMTAGILLLVLRRRFSRLVIEQQNRFWGLRFGDRALRAAEGVTIVVGIGLMIVGVLALYEGA